LPWIQRSRAASARYACIMRSNWIAVTMLVLCSSPVLHADDTSTDGATFVGGFANLSGDGAASTSLSSNINPATSELAYGALGLEAGVRYSWLGIHGGFGFGRVGGDETQGAELELRAGADARVMSGPLGLVGALDLVVVAASYTFEGNESFVGLAAEPRGGIEVRFSKKCWMDVLAGPRLKEIASASNNGFYANPQWGFSVALGVFYLMD
jgi:hypothetical protein